LKTRHDEVAERHAPAPPGRKNPEATSAEAARALSARLGKSVTGDWVRKTQQRVHAKYADLLIEEVAHSLGEAGPDALKQELQALDLLRYCRSALAKRDSLGC
jgi:hypothetical protein